MLTIFDDVNDDNCMVDLDDLEWEHLDHSNAGGEYEAFHDLSEEMYTVTGKYASLTVCNVTFSHSDLC